MNPIEITRKIKEIAHSYGYHDLLVIVYYNQYAEAVIMEAGDLTPKEKIKVVSQELLQNAIYGDKEMGEEFNCDGDDYFKVHVLKWNQGFVSLSGKFNNPREILEKSLKMLHIYD